MIPRHLEQLIASINALPGITKKQSERLAYNLLTKYQTEANEFVETYKVVKKIITTCLECGNLASDKLCLICKNLNGDRQNLLIIVESPLDIAKFEATETIKGYYHVLNGLVNIRNESSFENLNVQTLATRAKKFKEIILALSSNMEGIVTANYIKSILGHQKITQLAQGIPLGSAMEYVDQFTLKSALKNRKALK